jgi:dynein heavy chain 1
LDGLFLQESDASSWQAVQSFLEEAPSEQQQHHQQLQHRLFVWLERQDESNNSKELIAKASCASFPSQQHYGALCFCHNATDKIKDAHQIQCLTFPPAAALEEEDSAAATEEVVVSNNNKTSALEALQLYTRHVFVPSLTLTTSAPEDSSSPAASTNLETSVMMLGLQDKLRQLDVALGQCQKTTRLPQVVLVVHPLIAQVVAQHPTVATMSGSNYDWDQLGLTSKLQDDDFLNTLQQQVSQWIVQIRKLTVLPQTTAFPLIDATATSTTYADEEEMNFWTQLNVALEGISQEELSRPEVQLTLAMLRQAKRFLATIALENNSGLDQALSHTKDVLNFLNTYPLQQLTSATALDAVTAAMNAVFDHLPKIRSSRAYDLERCLQLFSATTLTLRRRLETILAQYNTNLILMDFDKFQNEIYFPTQDLFAQFDDRYDRFCQFVVEQGRRSRGAASTGKGGNKGSAVATSQLVQSIVLYHRPLQERLEAIYEFLRHHETLRQVVTQVLTSAEDDGDAIRQVVERAPRLHFASLENVLDTTTSGTKSLEAAMQEYDQQMDALEEKLARLLRDKLSACQDAEDMFQVFARFNPLLTRSRVRAAVKEFQMQLITNVGEAVKKLQSKFINKYEFSNAANFSRLRGIPPVAGKILWAKQMERQVQLLMTRMENVLGSDWGQQLEGRQLRKSGDELLAKLDARSFFRNWILEWEKELVAASSSPRLASYLIIVHPSKPGGALLPAVNFDEKNELLCKEIRYFKWLGLERDIPRTLTTVADETNDRYPFAMALKTALRSYHAVRILITPELEPLVMPQLLAIRECISNAFDVKLDTSTAISKKRRVRWDSKRELADFCNELTELVTKFEERVEQLLRACDKIDIALDLLVKVDYDKAKFQGILNNIQNSIDEMSLAGYASLNSWVSVVDRHLERVLAHRLELALQAWVHTLQIAASDDDKRMSSTEADDFEEEDPSLPAKQLSWPKVSIPTIAVEILLRNQEIMTVPAVPVVRSLFLDELHQYMGIVCELPRPRSGRFEVFDSSVRSKVKGTRAVADDEDFAMFDNLVQRASSKILAEAYAVTEQNIQQVTLFVEQWLAYQALWDTRVSDVVALVGNDFEKWQALLVETAEARSALDSSATMATFGPVAIKYNKVQSQINLKYDSWQKELQAAFSSILAESVVDCHQKINQAKTKLENVSLESSSNTTENIVLGVTFIQEMKDSLDPWMNEVDKLMSSERLLKLHRHHFRGDWMETSVVKGLHEHLQQILEKRIRTMEQQFPLLQARINAEDKASAKRFAELLTSWEQEKPLRGNLAPGVAMDILARYEFTLKKAQTDQVNLIKAKEALGLEHIGETSTIGECLEELSDMKEVWDAVMKPHSALEQIKDIPWSSAVMRKVKRELDDLLAQMRSLPNRIRQYDAFTHLHEAVKGYIAGYGLLSDLKTEALKERHWKIILERLGIRTSFSDLTVGSLWDHGVLSRKKEILEILTVAQGEMALEVFLGQVRDRWMKQELELVLYQNRVRLIRGWDDLFATLDDHMGGLILMKSSPYYRAVREFQEEGKLWEDRLTKLRAAFDAWVDVQRRWVYLEGILFGSSDIKAQLPAEWSRFKSVDGEFVTLMRRIASRPFAMEALNIENLQRTLERLRNLMEVIQRALGEYLEKQRADFSRFYFLGDDDLLEVMGNSGEPMKVLGHVSKMFAGIAGARQDTTAALADDILVRLDAMVSKDGEVVPFFKPIDVERNMSVKDWLQQLEDRMKNTLALLLDQAVTEDNFSQSTDGGRAFVDWATKFPAQVMILATQINWSTGVEQGLHDADHAALLNAVLQGIETKLEVMANTVLSDHPPAARKKFEQLITELVHQRDVTRGLIDDGVSSPDDFRWLYHLRYTYNPSAEKLTEKLTIALSNAKFFYGFEYLGIGERLVQTPLTDKCYLTLTQALHFRMGGSPFGPAGTGKTESVKALGAQLGRFVLVFNCDETFDFGAMGRLFAGLSQVGAWGCFDEFNRLEERILSAVSQQILTIQRGLLERKARIELLGRSIALHENVGIFVTMNPGYAGRSNLPDNLKSLFRSIAMVVPDRKLIAQVMLYSQGIVTAENLAGKVVDLFLLCEERMSKQSHYDFGLRALKTLLVSAGALKRQAMDGKEALQGEELALVEKQVLIAGACNNVVPKLVAEDMAVFGDVLQEVFPGSEISKMEDTKLRDEIVSICETRSFAAAERFIQKVLQLNQVLDMRHGVMVVGPVGSGKTAALQVLLEALERVDNTKGEMYVIDPKAIDKEGLYGSLDGTTMEWTDGVFTSLLRRILDNQKGESDKRHWIVFDGDVDPEWAENLNRYDG